MKAAAVKPGARSLKRRTVVASEDNEDKEEEELVATAAEKRKRTRALETATTKELATATKAKKSKKATNAAVTAAVTATVTAAATDTAASIIDDVTPTPLFQHPRKPTTGKGKNPIHLYCLSM